MKELLMVDVWTGTDDYGNPVGHGVKVGNEYYEYVKDNFTVIQYVNVGIPSFLENPDTKTLPYNTSFREKKHIRLWNIIRDIRYFSAKYPEYLIWFYAPDFYTYLAVCLCNIYRKSVLIAFEDYEKDKIKHKVFCSVKKKAAGLIITNRRLYNKNDKNLVYIPDYAYEESRYDKYVRLPRKECAVCLGTMNKRKMLEEAIYAFNRNGYKLLICGKFDDEEYYKSLCGIAAANVSIENRYIDKEEYYSLLGSSKYCLIPYDNCLYRNRTSGVLQEAMFMGTVPISHKEILDFNDIPGIGYENLSDMSCFHLDNINLNSNYKKYETKKKSEYSVEEIRHKLNGFLLQLTSEV